MDYLRMTVSLQSACFMLFVHNRVMKQLSGLSVVLSRRWHCVLLVLSCCIIQACFRCWSWVIRNCFFGLGNSQGLLKEMGTVCCLQNVAQLYDKFERPASRAVRDALHCLVTAGNAGDKLWQNKLRSEQWEPTLQSRGGTVMNSLHACTWVCFSMAAIDRFLDVVIEFELDVSLKSAKHHD